MGGPGSGRKPSGGRGIKKGKKIKTYPVRILVKGKGVTRRVSVPPSNNY
jgi:hypothetical protein